MATTPKRRRLLDAYRFPGFTPRDDIHGIFGDPLARVIPLVRHSKKTVCKDCGRVHTSWYDRTTRRVRDLSCADTRIYLEFEVRRLRCPCTGKVRREGLDFLADNPLYTKRFAWFVGRRCRSSTIKDVAKELNLHWGAVKELDKQYMRA